jgi:hypothetical protein
MHRRFAFAPLAALIVVVSGCAKKSPAIGTWTTTSPLGTATMTLSEGGTGTFAMPPILPSTPIKWEEKDGKVNISPSGAAPSPAPAAMPGMVGQPTAQMNMTASVSEDGKSLTLPFGNRSVTLNKQETK